MQSAQRHENDIGAGDGEINEEVVLDGIIVAPEAKHAGSRVPVTGGGNRHKASGDNEWLARHGC